MNNAARETRYGFIISTGPRFLLVAKFGHRFWLEVGVMTRRRRFALATMMAAILPLAGCDIGRQHLVFQGWVEADLVFVSPDEQGRINTLLVSEGDTVERGAPLFTVDSDLQQADLQQMKATLENTRINFDRAQRLAKEGFATQKSLDDARELLRAAEARFNSSQTRLVRREVLSPATGTIQQVYFRSGEMVSGARPVVALLPPGNIKLRFYAPEAVLPRLHLGDRVKVQCDGCAGDIAGRISFLSGTAEFTPPVIFSLEERAKMVFRVEARPQAPDLLRVGQPVTLSILDSARAASR